MTDHNSNDKKETNNDKQNDRPKLKGQKRQKNDKQNHRPKLKRLKK